MPTGPIFLEAGLFLSLFGCMYAEDELVPGDLPRHPCFTATDYQCLQKYILHKFMFSRGSFCPLLLA